jgi:hypothetical protein
VGEKMKPEMTFKAIIEQQKAWATNEGFRFENSGKRNGYTYSLADNLFYKNLSVRTLDEYMAGQGQELKSHMRALFSSSALVVNIFENWRQTQRISEVARECGASLGMTDMEFEKKHKIANLGTPTLDIEFSAENFKPFAIEAKFIEPYWRTTQRNKTNLDKYLKQVRLWEGLQKFSQLAGEVFGQEGKQTRWKHLDVPQLIKHVLGLSYCYKPNGFTLLYLWFDCDTEESREHRQEIRNFYDFINGEIDFRSMRYQELFANIKGLPDVDNKYLEYLNKRYFKVV